MPGVNPPFENKSWLKLTIRTDSDLSDLAADFVCRQSGGIEQIPDSSGRQEEIVAYLANDEEGRKKLRKLQNDLARIPANNGNGTNILIETTVVPDEDWNKTWKEQFRPFAITPHLVIKPSWESYRPGPKEKIIELDPGMAFGTGHHSSTKLALTLLEGIFHTRVEKPGTVLDVGTGTGILAMAAALFGAKEVLAIDNDPEAVTIARDNISRNALQKVITASDTDLGEAERCFDLVIANIIHDTLIELAEDLISCLSPKGNLILAGILTGQQAENIRAVYTRLGLNHEETRSEGEWSALLFVKP